jgi:hypothetical protein
VSTTVAQLKVRATHVVWAKLCVSDESESEIHDFFVARVGLARRFLKSGLRVSIYHARRNLAGLSDHEEDVEIEIDPPHLRFMVMTPGGENPRPDVDPSTNAIGVRIKRSAPEIQEIRAIRARFYAFETPDVLGVRRPSNHARSAFGARHFQPHITLLKSGCDIDRDLRKIGDLFRASISPIRLARLVVACRTKSFPPA